MKKGIWKIFVPVLAAITIWLLWGNTALERTDIIISGAKLPGNFDGFTIAHVSDLHNAEFGQGNEQLLQMLKDAQPDIIAITGDLIDSRNTDIETALSFVEAAVQIAPCYYVTGNHESRIPEYARLEEGLRRAGATVLRNEKISVKREEQILYIVGVDDPSFAGGKSVEEDLDALLNVEYEILLSHRPELFLQYWEYGADVVLSGHAHGGQFRLPYVGGLVAPNQGLFPRYDSGLYTKGDTHMVVSRGLGNSIIPLRVNNRPELIILTLHTEETV